MSAVSAAMVSIISVILFIACTTMGPTPTPVPTPTSEQVQACTDWQNIRAIWEASGTSLKEIDAIQRFGAGVSEEKWERIKKRCQQILEHE